MLKRVRKRKEPSGDDEDDLDISDASQTNSVTYERKKSMGITVNSLTLRWFGVIIVNIVELVKSLSSVSRTRL